MSTAQTPASRAHVCTPLAGNNFRIRVGGRQYTGTYLSGALAVLLTQCFYRVHNAAAVKVSQ